MLTLVRQRAALQTD